MNLTALNHIVSEVQLLLVINL